MTARQTKKMKFKFHLGVGWYKFTHIVQYIHTFIHTRIDGRLTKSHVVRYATVRR